MESMGYNRIVKQKQQESGGGAKVIVGINGTVSLRRACRSASMKPLDVSKRQWRRCAGLVVIGKSCGASCCLFESRRSV